jgi:hypothetical protein
VLLTCFNPMSIFFAIPYTEAFYLLITGLTLLCLVSRPLGVPGIALLGALGSATRPTGVVILPSILIAFARDRRAAAGLLACLGTLGGLGAIALINWRLSGDPLAFLHAQQAWAVRPGFNLSGLPFWLEELSKVFLGPLNTKASALGDGSYPAMFSAVVGVGALLLCGWGLGRLPLEVWAFGAASLVGFGALLLVAYALRFAAGLWIG